jgi:hypothetical protein
MKPYIKMQTSYDLFKFYLQISMCVFSVEKL